MLSGGCCVYRPNIRYLCVCVCVCVQGKYELVVVAADDDARDLLTSTTDVTIYVTDVNDNAPQFIRPARASSHEVNCDATIRVPHATPTGAVVMQVNCSCGQRRQNEYEYGGTHPIFCRVPPLFWLYMFNWSFWGSLS